MGAARRAGTGPWRCAGPASDSTRSILDNYQGEDRDEILHRLGQIRPRQFEQVGHAGRDRSLPSVTLAPRY